MVLLYHSNTVYLMLQTPAELHTFATSDAEVLPLMHLILKESPKAPVDKVLHLLRGIRELDIVCTNESARGLKAGKHFPQEALAILCEAAKDDKNVNVVSAMLDAGTDVDSFHHDLSPLMCAAKP